MLLSIDGCSILMRIMLIKQWIWGFNILGQVHMNTYSKHLMTQYLCKKNLRGGGVNFYSCWSIYPEKYSLLLGTTRVVVSNNGT